MLEIRRPGPGTGFNAETLRALHQLMVPLITDTKPVPERVPDAANTTWMKPKLVAEVKFTEWTEAGEMRHPVFLGLRPTRQRLRSRASSRNGPTQRLSQQAERGDAFAISLSRSEPDVGGTTT